MRDFNGHAVGKPLNPYAALRELRRGDRARLLAATAHLKAAFLMYEGLDRCRPLAVLEESISRHGTLFRGNVP